MKPISLLALFVRWVSLRRTAVWLLGVLIPAMGLSAL